MVEYLKLGTNTQQNQVSHYHCSTKQNFFVTFGYYADIPIAERVPKTHG